MHGDFHHHNILASARGHLAIDPQPFLGEPEYDIVPFLWNPLPIRIRPELLDARLAAFAAAGLDEERMRAWTVIRGSYLAPETATRSYVRSSRNGFSCSQRCSIVVVRAGWSGSYGT